MRMHIAPASSAFNLLFFDAPKISIKTSKALELAFAHISSDKSSSNDLNKSMPCS
ncbi:hypothetical protein Syun_018311 [Stephania yunnanensis]|uniref:Uncharacterized protein n=1 Tax=Stephania yunnanensis TaxID=152371 RepID=A0AAP0IS49_9MAGN